VRSRAVNALIARLPTTRVDHLLSGSGSFGAGLGDDDVGGEDADAGDGADWVAKPLKGRVSSMRVVI